MLISYTCNCKCKKGIGQSQFYEVMKRKECTCTKTINESIMGYHNELAYWLFSEYVNDSLKP